jgi:hypothetical protein
MHWELWVVLGAPIATLLFALFVVFFTEPIIETEDE